MKTSFKFLAVLTVLSLSLAPTFVRAQDAPPPPDDQQAPPPPDDQSDQGDQGASFQTFYDQLGSQGTWVQTNDYGYVFQPTVTDPDWAPYTDGHWVFTDVGWMWVSDEPWGWATYHYGRWANIDGFGWVWIPGYRWAPAWVSWRYGGGYCGWAPLPPGTFFGAEYGGSGGWATFHFGGDVDVSFGIGAGWYNFVRVGDMGAPNYRGHFIDRSNNFVVINKTTNITNVNISRNGGGARGFGGVSVGGPRINDVNAQAQERVPTVQLTASNRPGPGRLEGNSLAVYAPAMNPATLHTARPAGVSRTIAHPTFNRGDSITKPLDVTASVRPPAPTAEAIKAAETAQLHAPAKAKVATEKTAVRTTLTKPLTSLQPVAPVHHATGASANSVAPSTERANSVAPSTEHYGATAPFTGEPEKKRPEPQPSEVKPTPTYHPENVQTPTEVKPTPTYHPENVQPPTEVKPTPTYHPENVQPPPTYHPSSAPPTETYHPQSQPTHESAPPPRTEPAPGNHPAPTGGPAGKPTGDDKNKPQG
ncbi:MAG TPA: DUF6600 domain-containing protein [Candidatus Methylacidiphilales bacterium]|jgi:hypothetical protein|nr:DUF6600 domain-containing protein [Candidatus Methylacidiphilales bacterium]